MEIQENKERGLKHRDLDIQFDQRRRAVDGLPKVHLLWMEVQFLNAGIETLHGDWLLLEIGSTASAVSYPLRMRGSSSGYVVWILAIRKLHQQGVQLAGSAEKRYASRCGLLLQETVRLPASRLTYRSLHCTDTNVLQVGFQVGIVSPKASGPL